MKTLLIIFPFLLLITPMLQLWYKNYTEVHISLIKKLFIYYTVSYTIFYGMLTCILEYSTIKISLITTCCVYIFNYIYVYFKKMTSGKHFSTKIINGILLLFISITPVISTILPNNIVLLILKVLIPFSFITTSVYTIGILSLRNNMTEKRNETFKETINIVSNKDLPDIYYIVPDAYTGNNALNTFYNFDNSDFLQWLKDKGFKVYNDAKPNYPLTILSIGSTLNMDYLDKYFEYNDALKPSTNLINHQEYYTNNKVAKMLKSHGYKYYHILNYWRRQMFTRSELADVCIDTGSNVSDFVKILFSKTIARSISNELYKKNMKNSIIKTFDALESIALEDTDKPKFVMAHMICPHPPFFFDKDGEEPDKNLDEKNTEGYRKLYVGQLQYMNKKLKHIVTKILEHNKNSIIVIQADHGAGSVEIDNPNVWNSPNKDFFQERYNILRAIYANNIDFNCSTSVNIFRYILNNILNANLDILPDKCMFSNYDNPLKARELLEEQL